MILQMTRPVQGGLRQERHFENTANHLANVDTPGFKKDIVSFDAAFQAQLHTDLTQGPVRSTGNPLDFALEDEGFFAVQTPQGVRYTRNGSFTRNLDGTLVSQKGDPVLVGGQPLLIDGNDVQLAEDGTLFVDGEAAGVLDVVTFTDLNQLEKEGANLYRYKGNPAEIVAPPSIQVRQKALEMSNVESVVEMSGMITTHRMYETFQKMMMTIDEVDAKAINEVGRPQ